MVVQARFEIVSVIRLKPTAFHPPPAVRSATEDYRLNEDVLADFIDECCDTGPRLSVASSALFAKYREWCEHQNAKTWTQKSFNEAIEERGYKRIRSKRTRGFEGIDVKG